MKPKMTVVLGLVLMAAAGSSVLAGGTGERHAEQSLPDGWLASWERPPMEDRPLQIVHGIDPRRAMPEGIDQMLRESDPKRVASEGMRYYKDRGLGGVVCNVAFQDYMRSEEHWKTLVAGVEACRKLGLVVWLYDEDGYPSGGAGGLVLAENPALEATELAFDPARDDPFLIRPAYEHTHASNNYYAARRYANLIDDRACRSFIERTHGAYWERLEPYFGSTIQATFTDEPSLIAINIGQIPEAARKRVRVVDPLDPAVEPLPCVPWCYDLPQRYQERYGEDLVPHRRSLFAGDAPEDRKVRRQFWGLVADLFAQRYFGAIQEWCSQHHVASSGHSLHEESVMHQVALNGNSLKVLGRMDIPGLDMLSSNPEAVIHSGWLTAGLPSSAAILGGRRRVMTEVSDFSQKMGGAGPVSLAEMQATAAWQAAWGVTEFTLYYGLGDRSVEEYRAYCDYVGRLNAVLKPARLDRDVLLYYPIHDLWEEYLPVAEPLRLDSQSPRAQRIVGSFMRLGQTLQQNQIPFALVDHETLASAEVRPDGKLAIGDHSFGAVLLPEDAGLPPEAAGIVDRFRQQGGKVVVDEPSARSLTGEVLTRTLEPPFRLLPASPLLAMGQFVRDHPTMLRMVPGGARRRILLVVNVGREAYQGSLSFGAAITWQLMDPAAGTIRLAESDEAGKIPLQLAAREAIVLVEDR
ncbi:MAG: hypothetical protein A2V98_05845 [Planctomycetes bacterium RBG_16_64_12]|nr:MAG: hypothetical protein A2V98_05845 [Planctomycetes bacterium RBG_16_64_12]